MKNAPPPEPSIIRSTLRALLHPRRLIPIVLLSSSLVVAQGNYSRDPFAIPLGIAMCVAFVIVAPVSWRVLFPDRFNLRHGGIRLILYATIAAGVVLVTGHRRAAHPGHGPDAADGADQRRRLPGAVPRRRLGPGPRHVDGEPAGARGGARDAARARGGGGAAAGAARRTWTRTSSSTRLNAIAEWCREDGEIAERAVMQLSAMLRTVLAGVRASTWPLAEELALLDTLFELHRLRDPDRVRVIRQLPEPLPDIGIPPHVAAAAGGERGQARPGGRTRAARSCWPRTRPRTIALVVSIENPGAYRGRRPGGSGIEIVERRLALAYDDQAVLTIAAVGETTRAEVTLPMAAHPAGSPT